MRYGKWVGLLTLAMHGRLIMRFGLTLAVVAPIDITLMLALSLERQRIPGPEEWLRIGSMISFFCIGVATVTLMVAPLALVGIGWVFAILRWIGCHIQGECHIPGEQNIRSVGCQ